MSVKVVVAGACGKMGRETMAAVRSAPDLELIGAYDRSGGEVEGIEVSDTLTALLETTRPDVVVDFTHHSCSADLATRALSHKAAVVIGTSGLSPEDQALVRHACADHGTPALLVPNFAIGAVLMMRFAAEAARFLPDAEVIELHHENKLDSPSGTATRTAELIAAARDSVSHAPAEAVETYAGARGARVDEVPVHSVRLPGFIASQEVVFGAPGQRLSLRHDSIDRKCFMAGVLLAVRGVRELSGFVVGLDAVMGQPR